MEGSVNNCCDLCNLAARTAFAIRSSRRGARPKNVSIIDPPKLVASRSTTPKKKGMAENDSPPLGKFLASSGPPLSFPYAPSAHFREGRTRPQNTSYNSSQPFPRVLSDHLELAKLWKGIFYCTPPAVYPHLTRKCTYCFPKEGYWMSDKPLVQQALAAELADTVHNILDTSSSLLLPKCFGTLSSVNGTASIVSGTERPQPWILTYVMTVRSQNAQVLYADSAFRQRLLHSLDKR
jgi:hypothetical protein